MQNASKQTGNTITEYKAENILDSLVINGDISKLQPQQKVEYYSQFCRRIGLDPLTQPFKILRLNGKETFYCDRSGAAQLNKLHNLSHEIRARETVNDCYVVTAQASTPEGRKTESIGAVSVIGLKGESLCNAMMKAETKAKRRATLDLLGLGVLDESEVSNIQGAETVDIPHEDLSGNGASAAQTTPAPNKPTSTSVNVANAVPDATAKPAPAQVNINPFAAKYDSAGSVKLVLEQASSKQQMLDLYYGNQQFIDSNEELKKLFAGKRDEFVRAEQAELAKQQQSSEPKKDITEEEVKQVVARINRGELTAYNKADAAFNIPESHRKTMWDFFLGIYNQAIKAKHSNTEFIEYLISMAQNIEHLDTIYKSNTMIVDREPGMKDKWNDKYQSLGHNGNTTN